MKKIVILLFIFPFLLNGQTSNWSNNTNSERAFVKNKGQYDGKNWQPNNPIKFALSQQDGWYTFFTEKGITHRLDKLVRNPNKVKGEHNSPSRVHINELIDVFFIGANNNPQIIAEDKTDHYYSYAVRNIETKEVTNLSHINGYKKITYKNIYNNIDIEYTLHPDGGIKYNVILHPGADPTQIKMKYKTSHSNIQGEYSSIQLNQNNEIEVTTSLGNIIEHKPYTYYESSQSPINSKYVFNNNILTFDLENYDTSKKVIIDPWVVIPVFDDGDFTREVETDAAGNVYVIGGETPMQLRKYNSAGALQWTYNTPWDTTGGDWLGTLATDDAGVSYITQGTGPEIERISTAGSMVWHNNNSGWSVEYWSITFNCDNTKLIVGGTKSSSIFSFPLTFYAMMYDIDPNNGSVLAEAYLDTTVFAAAFPPPTPVEVRSITSSKNSKYIFLTHNDVGAYYQNFNSCPNGEPIFMSDNTEHLGYKCENYLSASQNGGGLKALATNDNYFYTHKGDEILQWDINTGTLINTVSLPNGSSNNTFGLVVHCSGLDVDDLGNVYAGTMSSVVKFDANLNVISNIPTTGGFTVYDVSVNSNGEVIAGGALLDNGTTTGRGGRIESLNMTASGQYSTVCCDPNFCTVAPLCINDAPVNLNPNTAGGTWSSSPVTAGLNTSTGIFDPSVAGIGTYTITYTLGCGSYSIIIDVISCTAMTLCVESNGDLTVSGGTGPYTWYEWTTTTLTPTTSAECTTCGGFWNPGIPPIIPPSCSVPSCTVAGWSSFGTGTTITPPVGADTVQVVDNFGNDVTSYDIGTLSPCSGCDATITQAGPFCVNDGSTTLTAAQGGGTWSGTGITNASAGTFDPATAGTGSWVITYSVSTCTDTMTIVVNPLPDTGIDGALALCSTDPSTDLFLQLGGTPDVGGVWSPALTSGTGMFDPAVDPAGTYSYSITNSCGSSSNDVVVTITANPSPGTNGTVTICSNATSINLFDSLGGAPDAGGTWSPALTSGTGIFDPTVDPAGTYTYSINYCAGNPQTADVIVTITATPNTGSNGAISFCSTDPAADLFLSLGGSPDVGGTWSPVLTSGTGMFDPAVDPAGTYSYSITNSCGSSSNDVVVTITANPSPGTNGTVSICSNATSINLFDSLGGTPDAGGTWSPALTSGTGIFDPAVDPTGTYTYSINDCAGNPQTADVVVTINPAPNTGTDGAVSLCPTDPATDLFLQLGGTPNVGGTWSPVLTSGTGMFDPAVDPAGTYSYSITNSCGSSSNDVVVTITANPSPGTNGTVTICSNATSINLFDSLGGAPDAGGTWSPALTSGTGIFDPTVDPSGTYTYSINDCAGNPQTADVVVSIITAPNTGTNGAIALCPTDPATDLFLQLGGSPDIGGTWSPSMASGTGFFDPAVDPAGTYTYSITNSCGSSSNDVVVSITANPSPGTNGAVTICSNATSINLLDSLGGSPDAGGTWTPALTSGTGIFDPAIDPAGTYTYTINDCAGNPLTADVIVTVNPSPNTGSDGAISLCDSDPSTDLFFQLGGSPDVGGTWSPAMASGSGVIDPTVDPAGTYTYSITNSCGTSSNSVVVTISSCTLPTSGYTVSNDTICEDDCVDFFDSSTGATSWQWTFTGGSPSSSTSPSPSNICFDSTGTYTIEQIVTNSNGSDTTTSTIIVNASPTIYAGPDVTIDIGESTTLTATGTNGVYTWSPPDWLSCFICPSTVSTPDETITYTVIVVDSNGCTATDEVSVIIDFENVIFVPNIFSPNGDGHNDIVYVRGQGIASLNFFIYDRWGEKVFETQSLDNGWDGTFRGKKMNSAVFVYYLQATFIDGSEVTQKGDITLIR
jgi:gliding motility-associated-like protein